METGPLCIIQMTDMCCVSNGRNTIKFWIVLQILKHGVTVTLRHLQIQENDIRGVDILELIDQRIAVCYNK